MIHTIDPMHDGMNIWNNDSFEVIYAHVNVQYNPPKYFIATYSIRFFFFMEVIRWIRRPTESIFLAYLRQ